ncbi:MAG: class I SAM-dependent methyltransferase [Alphaproteobacteria bacterium]|nr:class I SAM-dependent methyltransferase [Alphaproteobacteria bacterium]
MSTLPPLSHAGALKPLVEMVAQPLADFPATIWVGEADGGLPPIEDGMAMGDAGDNLGQGVFFHRHQASLPDWMTQPSAPRWQNALLAWPKSRAEGAMWLHLLGARLDVGGKLWVYGHNRGGIKSADRALAEVFGNAAVLASKAHGRLLQAVKTAPIGLGALADWAEAVTMTIPSLAVPPLAADASQPALSPKAAQQLTLTSYPGCFAHGRLDEGTAFLLAHLPPLAAHQRVLDYGCGIGVIAAALRARQPKLRLTLMDIDCLALHAAATNLPDDHGLASATLIHGGSLGGSMENFREAAGGFRRFDAIVSNPPIHQGAAENMEVLIRLIADAPRFLIPGGALYLVMQHRLNLAPLLQRGFENVRQLAASPQYKLWQAS